MTSTQPTASQATVATDRAARYGKQLASHLSRRLETSWDGDADSGRVSFDDGFCDLDAQADALVLSLQLVTDGDPELASAQLDRMEDVIGRHLVRFGARDELVAEWTRSDGSAGSVQRNEDGGPEGLHSGEGQH